MSLTKRQLGAGEVAQQARVLSKYEDLSLNPRHPHKEPGTVTPVLGVQRQEGWWDFLAASLDPVRSCLKRI